MTRCRKWQGRELCVQFSVRRRPQRYSVDLDRTRIGMVEERRTIGRTRFEATTLDGRVRQPNHTTLQKATSALADLAVRAEVIS